MQIKIELKQDKNCLILLHKTIYNTKSRETQQYFCIFVSSLTFGISNFLFIKLSKGSANENDDDDDDDE